jgi:hypothetical protein
VLNGTVAVKPDQVVPTTSLEQLPSVPPGVRTGPVGLSHRATISTTEPCQPVPERLTTPPGIVSGGLVAPLLVPLPVTNDTSSEVPTVSPLWLMGVDVPDFGNTKRYRVL